MFLRAVATSYDPLQPETVRGAYLDADPLAHAATCHNADPKGNL